jgi:hypothetical protein
MKKVQSYPVLILFSLFSVAGCVFEADDERTEVRSLEVIFSMDEAVINGEVASAQFGVPSITPAVTDFGAVMAYFREQGTWTAMPYTFGEESPDLPAVDYTITLGYGYDDGLLEVFYEASTEEAPLFNQPDRRIKVVIIDDLSVSRAARLDLTNYEAVRAEFNLDD